MTPEVLQHVAAHRRLKQVIKGRAPPKRYHFAPQKPPKALALSYAADLLRLVAFMRRTVEARIARELPGWVRESDFLHGRADAASEDAAGSFAELGEFFDKGAFSTPALTPIARKAAERTAAMQKAAFQHQLQVALGVEVPIFDKHLGPRVAAFTAENVALIQSIPRQSLQQVQSLVLRGLARGDRAAALAIEIGERFDVSESRAALIARDQTLKFFGSLNESRQRDVGITHFIWTTPNDERTCPECDPYDGQRFAWADAPGGGPGQIHPQCFPGNVRISPASSVEKLYRWRFDGRLTELVTADGVTLQSTPNHPILTTLGWRPAHLVDVGDHLFKTSVERVEPFVANMEDAESQLVEVFDAAALAFGFHSRGTGAAGFHGDSIHQQVDVVDVDWSLGLKLDPTLSERLCQDALALADSGTASPSPLAQLFDRVLLASNSSVRGACQLLALFGGHVGLTDEHRLRLSSWLDAVAAQLTHNYGPRHVEALCHLFRADFASEKGQQRLLRKVFAVGCRALVNTTRLQTASAKQLAERVAGTPHVPTDLGDGHLTQKPSCVVEKRLSEFASSHVYNLQTAAGWYRANRVTVANCRCSAEPDVEALLDSL